MAYRTIFLGLGIAAALRAGAASADDPTARLLLERAQRADAFTLGVQQSIEHRRAGTLGPRQQLELDARQRDQRQEQDALFYRQAIGTYAPAGDTARRLETMRGEQERQEQLSRFRFEAESLPGGKSPTPALRPPLAPTLVTVPIPRAPADPARVAAMPSARPVGAGPLAEIRRVEHDADALWRAALARDWNAAQDALGDVRRSVEALRSDRFTAAYAQNGGRADALSVVLDRLDTAIAGAEIPLGARDAPSAMDLANHLMLTAAELVPDIVAARERRSIRRK
ncbi:MAG: hypothetical protein AMJ64_13710 [Betaproteobacteria bacterium SG8_39]|nr:MAG: hypothetical protein AMJ64_13710 [Betaproteobacteria bacterium SG8_39]